MNQAAITEHVVDVARAARDWAVIQSEPDPEIRMWLMKTHLFEIAKDIAGAHTATKHPTRPVAITRFHGSMSIVLGDREICVTANLMTRDGRVTFDERDVRRAA